MTVKKGSKKSLIIFVIGVAIVIWGLGSIFGLPWGFRSIFGY